MTERIERWSRGLASLALLVGLVVGVPAALVVLGGNPLPRRVDAAGLWAALLRPDDGTVLARLLALVGWVAWAVFTVTVLVELGNLARSGSRGLVLPGLGGVQQWAAGLMLTVVAIGAASQLTAPAPHRTVQAQSVSDDESRTATALRPVRAAPSAPGSATSSGAEGAAAAVSTPERTPAPPATSVADPRGSATTAAHDPVEPADAPHGLRPRVHVVETGDDLWSLAERYYGRGPAWRRIAAANPERLTGGPDRLRAGWRLVIPEVEETARHDTSGDDGTVRVRPGDTLSSIAEQRLGDAARWRALFRANADQLTDPDDLPVGLVLRLPSGSVAQDRGAERRSSADGGESITSDTGEAEGNRVVPDPEPGNAASSSPPASTAPTTGARPEEPPAGVPGPVAAGPEASATEVPTEPAGGPAAEVGEAAAVEDDGAELLLPGLATVGGLLAAALTGGLAARRRWQLQQRPVGRRIAHPAPETRPVEVALARRVRPIGLRTLDRAGRAVAAAAAQAGVEVPGLRTASVSAEWLVLELTGTVPPAPRCFVDTGAAWCLAADAVDGLRDVPGLGEASRPWPLLVGVGTDDDGADRVVDLESRGLLAVTGDAALVTAALAATALELACSPWTEELRLSLVGDDRLADALAQHNVQSVAALSPLLERLERTAAARVAQAAGRHARDRRSDRDRAEAWAPEVVVVDAPLSADEARRLLRLTAQRGAAISAVVRGPVVGAGATLALEDGGRAVLQPDDLRLAPQLLTEPALGAVVDLVRVVGAEETTPAPWWSSGDDPPGSPPDNVTYLGARRRTDEQSGVEGQQDRDEQERRAAVQARMTEVAEGTVRHPLLQLLGPVELLGAHGVAPTRAARQCLEYCAWLLENPGTTAQAMAASLLVAEGTRRSNMSRLRTWLGDATDGQPYLPDAYSGRIWLDPVVSSDWHQLQLLVGDGVDRAPTSVLELGLRLVRGAPLADAAPVQWHWAESLRTDMVSCVRDIGAELSRRALEERDLDLARWAAARALAAAPGDEVLLRARLRTEHLAGNAAETERLSLQIAQQARILGADLDPATVDLIQEVMEGRIRARLA